MGKEEDDEEEEGGRLKSERGRQMIKRKRKERRVGRKEGKLLIKIDDWREEGELSMFYVVRSPHTQTKESCCGLFFFFFPGVG